RVLVVDHHGLVGAAAADRPPPHAPAAEPPSLALPAALAALPLCHLGDLLVQALELGGSLELGLLALRPARGGGTRRRRRRVLGLAHRHEAEHPVHELQVALDLEQRLRRAAYSKRTEKARRCLAIRYASPRKPQARTWPTGPPLPSLSLLTP